jgi:hypothetical protein
LTAAHRASRLEDFRNDLAWFAAVCRVANGMRNLRVGSIGARPTAFNTVRYSEKLLEASGISTETLDLSEVFGRIAKLKDDHAGVQGSSPRFEKYVTTSGVPDAALIKMAKLGFVVDDWMKADRREISAVQCWTSMEEYFGVVPCTIMSMMSNNLFPAACEVDVAAPQHARPALWRRKLPARCSTGTTITATIPTKPSASTAATCPNISSRTSAWISRRSSPAPSARTTPSAPSSAA